MLEIRQNLRIGARDSVDSRKVENPFRFRIFCIAEGKHDGIDRSISNERRECIEISDCIKEEVAVGFFHVEEIVIFGEIIGDDENIFPGKVALFIGKSPYDMENSSECDDADRRQNIGVEDYQTGNFLGKKKTGREIDKSDIDEKPQKGIDDDTADFLEKRRVVRDRIELRTTHDDEPDDYPVEYERCELFRTDVRYAELHERNAIRDAPKIVGEHEYCPENEHLADRHNDHPCYVVFFLDHMENFLGLYAIRVFCQYFACISGEIFYNFSILTSSMHIFLGIVAVLVLLYIILFFVFSRPVDRAQNRIIGNFLLKVSKIPALIEVMRRHVADEKAFDTITTLHSTAMIHRYDSIYSLLEQNARIQSEFLFLMKLSMQIPDLQKNEQFLYIREFIMDYERKMKADFVDFNREVNRWNQFVALKNLTVVGLILPGKERDSI